MNELFWKCTNSIAEHIFWLNRRIWRFWDKNVRTSHPNSCTDKKVDCESEKYARPWIGTKLHKNNKKDWKMWIIKKKVLVRKYELPISQNGVPKFYLKWGVFSCFFSVTFEQLNFRLKCCWLVNSRKQLKIFFCHWTLKFV